jgi:capsular polysaccharide biosynthesis protein
LSLIDYGRLLARRGWIIVLLAVLAAAAAFLLSRELPRTYRASQIVLIQPSRNDLGLTDATQRLMNSYVVYLRSSFIAQRVIDTLRLDRVAGELLGDVTISSDRNNLTVQIDVEAGDCAVAGAVAAEWGNQLVAYRAAENQTVRQEDRIDALLADNALCPTATTPNVTVNAAVGGLLGLLVGALIVFVLEYLESSIVRGRADLERETNLPVLATIPAASAASASSRSDT